MQQTPYDTLREFAIRIVSESGNKELWDVDAWLTTWLELPNPALGSALPSEILQTDGGLDRLVHLLACARSGVYL